MKKEKRGSGQGGQVFFEKFFLKVRTGKVEIRRKKLYPPTEKPANMQTALPSPNDPPQNK